MIVESSVNGHLLGCCGDWSFIVKNINGPEEWIDARRGSLMWSSMIWIYLEMYSGDI